MDPGPGERPGRFSDLDLDLAIDAGETLSIKELARIQYDFEESDLPWRVDVVDLNAVSDSFRKSIMEHEVPLRAGEGRRRQDGGSQADWGRNNGKKRGSPRSLG